MTLHSDNLSTGQQHPPQVGGRFAFDDGGAYCGGWAAGKAHGHGVCTGPGGQGRYEGAWNRGYETSGTYTWPSGNTYAGQWNQGKRHGLGEETKGKWTYRGEWTQGNKGRYGVRQSASSSARYDGTWTSGLQDGYGVETYVDGGSYRGQWLQGCRHGFGIRQSVPYGVAVHYRQKTFGGSTQHSSSQSSVHTSSLDEEDHVPTATHRSRDMGRGGFVLVARSDSSEPLPTPATSTSGGFRGAVARTLKLRRQMSAGEVSTPRSGRRAVRDSSGSRSASEDRESAHTDSCTSFVSQDDVRGVKSNPSDTSVVETYAGEWKNDKRSGYGVCERTDGIKFEGEWFNNKKNGYGATTFPDGSVDEGKYRDNELITLLPTDKSASGMFAIRTKKLRERIDSAVMEANQAAQIALQKTDIAKARMETARTKAEQTNAVAKKARADAVLACQNAAEFEHIELHVDATAGDNEEQSNDADAAAAAEPERRQSRSLSIIARALGKGLDSRRPSTVAAVFAAATTRWSRRPSSARPPADDADDDTSARPRKLAVNSVTWQDAGNPLNAEQQTTDKNANTISDIRQTVQQTQAAERPNAEWRTENRLRSDQSSHRDDQLQQQPSNDSPSTRPQNHLRHNDINNDAATTTQRRLVDVDNVPDRYNDGGGDRVNYGPRAAPVDSVRGSSPHRRRRIVRGRDRDSGALADDENAEAEYLDSEDRDELRALRSDSATPAGGMRLDRRSMMTSRYQPVNSTTAMTSSATSAAQPARRLTLPSIVKVPDVSSASPTASLSNTRHKANEAKPDISMSKPDTYVIIDGVRKRVTDDVSARRHQQADAMAGDHLARTTIPPTYGEDIDYRGDEVALPSRYALEPITRTTRNPNDVVAWPSTSTHNRGSLPDLFAGPPILSRQEAHLLSNWRREELRQLREEEDRRGRISIILSVGLLRDWYSQQKFLIFVVALNISLAAVFWHLLTTS